MSGICGICEPGAQVRPGEMEPMLRACGLTEEARPRLQPARGALFGVSPRWQYQAVAAGMACW